MGNAKMIDRRTATWQELKELKEVHDMHLLKGVIGEPTYLVSLRILGFSEREARDELAYIKGKK